MAEDWVPQLAQRTTAPIHQDRQTVRARAAADLFLGRGRPGHGEFRRSDGPILNPCQLEAHGSQVGPLGRRSLQQLAVRTALSGTNRVFYCRAGYCTRPPRSPPVGRGRHQRTQRPLPLRLSLAFKLHACRITPAGINCHESVQSGRQVLIVVILMHAVCQQLTHWPPGALSAAYRRVLRQAGYKRFRLRCA